MQFAHRERAKLELLERGSSVMNDLLLALEQQSTPNLVAPILRLLLQLGDSRALDAFNHGLRSDDEEIRAISAQGLYRLGAPNALEAALFTIDDSPDPLHADVTPSIRTLTAFGLPALPSVLSLLDANEPRTRQHAQKALEQITYNLVTRRAKLHSSQALEGWQELWEQNGNYQWDAPPTQRAIAIRLWQRWLARL